MTKYRLNYNEIAHLFDEPIRDHPVDPNLLAYLAEHPKLDEAETAVLDIGCGTGKQLTSNHHQFPTMRLVGVDPFDKMLQIARSRCRAVEWVQGDGAGLPFLDNSFHYATNQFSYQHMRQQERFIQEVYRVLRKNGRFVMTNIDPWVMQGWLIYRYFPATWELDVRDYLTVEEFTAVMQQTGFAHITTQRTHYSRPEMLSHFLAYASQRHRTSQFMAISDNDYQEGLSRIQTELAQTGDKELISEFCLVKISGNKL